MIGAIFAGGYGKRLRSEYPDTPKVLLPLKKNFVIMDKQLLDFSSAGMKDVYLLTGYKGDMIESRYGGEWRGMRIHYLREKVPMGTLWAVSNLFSNIDDDVLLKNGDTICNLDLKEFASKSISRRKLVSMVIVRMRSPFGIVSLDRNTVIYFKEKPLLQHYINGGIYLLKKGVKDFLKREYEEKYIEDSLFRILAAKKEIYAYRFNGFWKPIDSVKDYEEARQIFADREF